MDANEQRVESALASYPVSPLPPGFKRRVMAEIARYETRFHLNFLDFALPAFLWLFCSISLLSLAWILYSVDSMWFVQFQLILRSLQILLLEFPYWPAVIFSVLGLGTIVLSSLIAYFALAPHRLELR